MKKLFWLGIVFTLLISSHTFAAGSMAIKVTGTDLVATLSGVKGNTDTFRLVILKNEFPSGSTPSQSYTNSALLFTDPVIMEHKPDTDGKVIWTLTGYSDIKPGTTYYARAVEIGSNDKLTYATSTSTFKTEGVNTAPTALPFTFGSTGTTLTATLNNVTGLGDTYKLVVQTTPFTETTYSGTPSPINTVDATQKPPVVSGGSTTGTVTWSVAGYLPNTTYYARVVEIPKNGSVRPFYITGSSSIKTGEGSVPLFPLTTKKEGDNIIVSGKIDISKLPTKFVASDYKISLYYTKVAPTVGSTSLSGGLGPLTSRKVYNVPCDNSKEACVNEDGTYYWYLNVLNPSTIYYFQQTLTIQGNKTPIRGDISNFNSTDGVAITAGSVAEKADLNKRSYTLLSGFPNFTVLPDPDLCAQQRAQGLKPQFCDINDVLNYALKLLIGLSAVVLVFRLMYEGYVYMVSDVPFLKANAKSGFFTALGGLLLALTSFIILNTINPKLVDGSVNVAQLSILEDDDYDITPIITPPSGASVPSGSVGKCSVGVVSFDTPGGKFWACKSISAQFSSMMTAAYAAKIPLSGGGFRTAAEQIALRKSHCGAANIFVKGAKCSPPTALPGKSNHESGLAFDLTCNKELISTHDNKCFLWLQANASKYGLKNFPKEPWHWSTDGR